MMGDLLWYDLLKNWCSGYHVIKRVATFMTNIAWLMKPSSPSQHLAASKGYEDIVQFLIHEGADINITGIHSVKWHICVKFQLLAYVRVIM
jgi:hypothetical protein